MAANVETMFSGRDQIPWHGEGKIVKGMLNSQDAIVAAGLNWNVIKANAYLNDKDGYAPANEYFFIKRDDRIGADSILGCVGKNYNPLQNIDAFKFFDSVIGEGHANYDTAGALGHGERIWIMAKLPETMKVASDIVEEYILLSNSHDGSSSITAALTNVRVVCQNTLSMALRSAKKNKIIKVRHTSNVEAGMKEGMRIIGMVKEQAKEACDAFNKMANTVVDTTMVQYFLEYVIPSANAEASTRAKNVRDVVQNLFEGSARGADQPKFKGTAWGLYNSVVEYIDYYRTAKDRLQNIWFGSGAGIKEDAFEGAVNIDNIVSMVTAKKSLKTA